MSGANGSPYRPPCGGTWSGALWLGDPNQHYRASEANLPRYVNTTQVQTNYGVDATLECLTAHPSPRPDTGIGVNAWPSPPPANTYAAAASGICNSASPATVNAAACLKYGFKNVFAMKAWHGMFGFTDDDGCCPAGDAECCISGADERESPPSTKYLQVSYSFYTEQGVVVSIDDTLGDRPCHVTSPGVTCSAAQARTFTVDRYSGVVTLSGATDTPPSPCGGMPGYTSGTGSGDPIGALIKCRCGVLSGADPSFNIPGLGSSGGVVALANHDWDSPTGAATKEICTVTNTSIDYQLWTRDWDDCSNPANGTPDPDTGKYYYNYTYYHITAALGIPFTSDNLNSDVDALLGWWDLSDDRVHPWRQDSNCTNGPLVFHNETSPTSPAGMWQDIGWTDPNAATCDGSVLGKPNPAGHDPFYDFTALNYDNTCADVLEGQCAFAPGWAPHATRWTNCQFGKSLWPGAFRAFNSLGGGVQQGWLVAAKYAEVLIPKPSHDFGRPWGRDRYATEQSTVRCVTAFDGTTVTLESANTLSNGDYVLVAGWTSTALDGIYQITSAGTNVTSASWTVGSKIVGIAGRIDSGTYASFGKLRWPTAPSVAGSLSVTAATNTNPIQITVGDTDANQAAKAFFAETGDKVTISGCLGNTAANGTFTITKTGDYTFTIPVAGNGAYTGGGALVSAAMGVMSSAAPADAKWRDTKRKGDYLLGTWNFNWRDIGIRAILHDFYTNASANTGLFAGGAAPWEYADGVTCTPFSDPAIIRPVTNELSLNTFTQECQAFLPCCPAVICISPNGESFPNGQTFALPTLACDERFGSLVQVAPIQWMLDPLWETPHKGYNTGSGPCTPLASWTMDDGACGLISGGNPAGDYAFAPLEEARATIPSGAPSLPSGTFLPGESVTDLNASPPVPGVQIFPPQQGSCTPLNSLVASMPWEIFTNEQICLAAAGAYACEYADPENVCEFIFDE